MTQTHKFRLQNIYKHLDRDHNFKNAFDSVIKKEQSPSKRNFHPQMVDASRNPTQEPVKEVACAKDQEDTQAAMSDLAKLILTNDKSDLNWPFILGFIVLKQSKKGVGS